MYITVDVMRFKEENKQV